MPYWPESEESQMDPYYHNIKSTIVIIIILFFFVNSIQTQILGFLLDCICAANQDFLFHSQKDSLVRTIYNHPFGVLFFISRRPKSGFFLGFNPQTVYSMRMIVIQKQRYIKFLFLPVFKFNKKVFVSLFKRNLSI